MQNTVLHQKLRQKIRENKVNVLPTISKYLGLIYILGSVLTFVAVLIAAKWSFKNIFHNLWRAFNGAMHFSILPSVKGKDAQNENKERKKNRKPGQLIDFDK